MDSLVRKDEADETECVNPCVCDMWYKQTNYTRTYYINTHVLRFVTHEMNELDCPKKNMFESERNDL